MRQESSSNRRGPSTSSRESRYSWARGLRAAHRRAGAGAVGRHIRRVGFRLLRRVAQRSVRPRRPGPDRVGAERSPEGDIALADIVGGDIAPHSAGAEPGSGLRGLRSSARVRQPVEAACWGRAPGWRWQDQGRSCREPKRLLRSWGSRWQPAAPTSVKNPSERPKNNRGPDLSILLVSSYLLKVLTRSY